MQGVSYRSRRTASDLSKGPRRAFGSQRRGNLIKIALADPVPRDIHRLELCSGNPRTVRFNFPERFDRNQRLEAAHRKLLVCSRAPRFPIYFLLGNLADYPCWHAGHQAPRGDGGIGFDKRHCATILSAPTSAPSMTTAFMPINALRPMRQPCSTAPWPI